MAEPRQKMAPMNAPGNLEEGPPGGVLSEASKKPFESKKWTAFMWIHTTFMAYLFFLEFQEANSNMVKLATLGILGAMDVLYLGGVYALDKYQMGLVDIVRAVKGIKGGKKEVTQELPDSALSYGLTIEDEDTAK